MQQYQLKSSVHEIKNVHLRYVSLEDTQIRTVWTVAANPGQQRALREQPDVPRAARPSLQRSSQATPPLNQTDLHPAPGQPLGCFIFVIL